MIGERWGVTAAEVARRYPCDDFVPVPTTQLWRGVTIEASPAELWPWVCQVRLAPYSYDWIDNLGRRSPRELRGLPDPRPGNPFTRVGGMLRIGRILAVEPQRHLTARIRDVFMTYALTPTGVGTRLVMKLVMEKPHWYGAAVALGDWPMARRQLLNFKALAEESVRTPGARPQPS